MAGGRKPGPQCLFNDKADIDHGTMCLAPSPAPGPLGTTADQLTYEGHAGGVSSAYAWAIQLVPAALYRETGYPFGEILKGVIPDLLQTVKALTTTATGALPGARIAIRTSLGLDFLPPSVDSSAEIIRALQVGISRATPTERRGADRDQDVEAAEALAVAAALLVRLILQGIVAYLLKDASMAPARGATGPAVRIPVTRADEAVAQLVRQLRASKLGYGFATWIEKNWKELVTNARLRIRQSLVTGSTSAPAERVLIEHRPAVPVSQPVSDPPTFSDINLAAQAATLVAAAAQGKPFCPE